MCNLQMEETNKEQRIEDMSWLPIVYAMIDNAVFSSQCSSFWTMSRLR